MAFLPRPSALLAALTVLATFLQRAEGLGAGAKIPDPTNIFKEKGMSAFDGTKLRYSMTVSIMNDRDLTYLGPRWNEELEVWS